MSLEVVAQGLARHFRGVSSILCADHIRFHLCHPYLEQHSEVCVFENALLL